MSLDVRLLEKARELGNGIVQARCPACAEDGGDRAGEHLRVYPDGRFGCCVHPKDSAHRKRIFALVGDKSPRSFTVKVASAAPTAATARSVTASLASFVRTVRTPVSESVSTPTAPTEDSRTLRTPFSNPRACVREDEMRDAHDTHTCKDNESGVLPVLTSLQTATERLPHFTPGGTLVIPFDSPERFHWWKGGQSVAATRAEVESWIREGAGKEFHGTGV